jgi:hypothetical protein
MNKISKLVLTLLAAAILGYGCATPEPTAKADAVDVERQPLAIFDLTDELVEAFLEEFDMDEMSEQELALYQTRSRMSDAFSTQFHDMPDFYLQEVEEQEVDIYQGYRIQILSTRDVEYADSTLAEFEKWADQTIADYSPRGYVHFRQPYYRVRIGDFQDRERAIEFSRLIKFKYPDAWIIHDRINPYRVPADTIEFRIIDILDRIEDVSRD